MTTEAVPALERESQEMAVVVQGLTVHDAESYAAAGEWIKTVAVYLKKVNEVMGPIVAAANHAHKVAVQQRDSLLRPAEGAKRILGERMATWDQAQARQRREAAAAWRREQERLEAEARAQAEAEARRLAREAEDRRLEEATRMEAAGDRAGAVKLIEAPIPVPIVTPAPVFAPAPPPPMAPTVEGVSHAETWTAEVTDLPRLVQAIAAGVQPITLVLPNSVALNGLARSLKGAMVVPGVRAVSNLSTRVKAS